MRLHGRVHLAVEDDLATCLARCFQQDGVHVIRRFKAGSLRLKGLCTPYLTALPGNKGVERHILRLKRRNLNTQVPEYPAEAGDNGALSGAGSCSLYHYRFSHF